MIVVKLGGSLAEAGSLRGWLAALARGGGRCVIVPGGGIFAETVRAAQPRYGFSDRAAHRMALLAMHQYAFLMADLAAVIEPAPSAAEIATSLAAGRIPVWLPSAMALADPAIEASWDITSDSLAAWLAGRLAATRLVLVKSAPPPPPPLTARRLAAAGLVDPAFPGFADGAGCALGYCGPGDEQRLAAAIGLS